MLWLQCNVHIRTLHSGPHTSYTPRENKRRCTTDAAIQYTKAAQKKKTKTSSKCIALRRFVFTCKTANSYRYSTNNTYRRRRASVKSTSSTFTSMATTDRVLILLLCMRRAHRHGNREKCANGWVLISHLSCELTLSRFSVDEYITTTTFIVTLTPADT